MSSDLMYHTISEIRAIYGYAAAAKEQERRYLEGSIFDEDPYIGDEFVGMTKTRKEREAEIRTKIIQDLNSED